MAPAAQEVLLRDISPALQRLTASLERTLQRNRRRHDVWLAHAVTAVLSAAFSAVLVHRLMVR